MRLAPRTRSRRGGNVTTSVTSTAGILTASLFLDATLTIYALLADFWVFLAKSWPCKVEMASLLRKQSELGARNNAE